MKEAERRARGQWMREQMAYLRIARGLMLKECAEVLSIPLKSACEHWLNAKLVIRGMPIRQRRKPRPRQQIVGQSSPNLRYAIKQGWVNTDRVSTP